MVSNATKLWEALNTGSVNPYGPHNPEARAFGNNPAILGITYFFRYPGQEETMRHLADTVEGDIRILVIPGSIGCEAYTLAMIADRYGLYNQGRSIEIHSLELRDDFTRTARFGHYPGSLMPPKRVPDYLACFNNNAATRRPFDAQSFRHSEDVAIRTDLKQKVRFITGNILDYIPDQRYDAVFCLALLGYFKGFQDAYLRKLRDLSRNLIIVDKMDAMPHKADNHPFKGINLLDADWKPIPEDSLRRRGLQTHFPSEWFDSDEAGTNMRHNMTFSVK